MDNTDKFIQAARNGDTSSIRRLMTDVDIHAKSDEALYTAIITGHTEIADLLLNFNLCHNPLKKSETFILNPIFYRETSKVKLFLEYGVIPTESDLMYAIDHGCFEIVKLLLDYLGNIVITEEMLVTASCESWVEIVKLLLDYGADPEMLPSRKDVMDYTYYMYIPSNVKLNEIWEYVPVNPRRCRLGLELKGSAIQHPSITSFVI